MKATPEDHDNAAAEADFQFKWFPPQTNEVRHVVLLLHGIGYRGAPYGEALAPGFASTDVALATITLPGHGLGLKGLSELASVALLGAALDSGIEASIKTCPNAKIVLAGESMGAAIIAGCIASGRLRMADRLSGVIFVVPAFGLRLAGVTSFEMFAAFAWGIARPRRAVFPLTGSILDKAFGRGENREWLHARRNDRAAASFVSATYLLAISRMARTSLQGSWGLPLPALIVTGSLDILTSVSAARRAFDTWRCQQKQFSVLPAGHCMIFNPAERPLLVAEIMDWLRELPDGPAISRSTEM